MRRKIEADKVRLEEAQPKVASAKWKWTWAWIAWIVAFFVIEFKALLNKQEGDTLSEHLRSWFCTMKQGRLGLWSILLKVVPLGFLIWFAGHLYFGW